MLDDKTPKAAVAAYRREPYRWSEVAPTLEDVFIQLMNASLDNVL